MSNSVLLADKWEGQDPTGWWMSEKLDGLRAWWTGKGFLSRQGNSFHPPEWFVKNLPAVPLDGELWCGRGQFKEAVSVVKNSKRQDDWKFLTYFVFDAPKHAGAFEERMAFLKEVITPEKTPHARVVGHVKCKGEEHLRRVLAEVEDLGGEGLMLRQAKSAYEHCRSTTLLKVKTFYDEEAKVVGYKRGQGRNQFRMGHLICVTPDGREFSVGGGFTDKQRDKPPKIGSIITYKYFEISEAGKPRFPIFVGVRFDVDWKAYCASYKRPEKKKPVALKRSHTILFSSVPASGSGDAATATASGSLSLAPLPPAPAAAAAAAAAAPAPAAAASARPPCKYGAGCFRVNAEHLEKYSHPAPTAAKYVPVDGEVSPPIAAAGPVIPDEQGSPLAAYESEDEADVAIGSNDDAVEEKKRKEPEPAAGAATAAEEKGTPPAKKQKEEEDTRPLCRYGSKCFQKGKDHKAKFRHPEKEATPAVAPAAAAAAPPPVADDLMTQPLEELITASRKKLPKVVLMEEKTKDEFEMEEGVNTLGRGFAGLTSAHISRKQLDVVVSTSAGKTRVLLIARGANPVIVKHGDKDWEPLPKDKPFEVVAKDIVSLLPDKSAQFRIAIL